MLFLDRMQLVRVLVNPRFGWTVESMKIVRWFDLVAICTDQVVFTPPSGLQYAYLMSTHPLPPPHLQPPG